jgi:hypothetical protein
MKLTMKTQFHFFCMVLVLLGAANRSPAQGAAFTYQGQLQENGAPAGGTYNLTFSLFNTSSGGNATAGPITNNGVIASNGLFTVLMDFGPGVFTGVNNWLEIGVQTNGANAMTTLTPRQQLTPTPYSVFSEGANAAGLTGAIPAASLSGAFSAAVNLTNPANIFAGNGGGITNINAAALTGALSTLNVSVLNATNLVLAQDIQQNQYGPSFNLVGLTSSNTFYALPVQWTNTGGAWVLALITPPILPQNPGIPTNSTGNPITGYYSIYDAQTGLSAGALTSWPDLGPYAHNLTAGAGSAPTVLAGYFADGAPAVAFSNAPFVMTYYMSNADYTSPAVASEIFIMMKDNNAAQTGYSGQGILTSTNGGPYGTDYYVAINNGIYDLRGFFGGTFPGTSATAFPTNTWVVCDFVFATGDNGAIYTNNVAYLTGQVMGTGGITNSLQLGGLSFNGYVSFVGIYTNILSPADRNSVYNYLTNRYH